PRPFRARESSGGLRRQPAGPLCGRAVAVDDPRSLDRLVNELNSSVRRPGTPSAPIADWLESLRAEAGSDLYLVAGLPPSIRVDGVIRALPAASLDSDDIEQQVLALLPPKAAERYRATGSADASFRQGSIGRFGVNVPRERGRAAASIRAVPLHPPELAALAVPTAVEALTRLKSGLVLVGGPTGSGKTTTVAALVDAINRRDAKHIITIEDPIEYDHAHQ